MRSKPLPTKLKENDMYVSRDPALMERSEHIRRQVELFVRGGGKIERLPDFSDVPVIKDSEYNGRKMPAQASRDWKAGK